MLIYKTTNLITGMIYIGKAVNKNSKYLGSGIHLKLAIAKYGKEHFRREIIDFAENRVDQNCKERFWIAFYRKELGRDNVYNVSDGGDGGFGAGVNSPWYGKSRSSETIEKMRLSRIGRKCSDETKQKLRAKMMGKKNPNYGRTDIGKKRTPA